MLVVYHHVCSCLASCRDSLPFGHYQKILLEIQVSRTVSKVVYVEMHWLLVKAAVCGSQFDVVVQRCCESGAT